MKIRKLTALIWITTILLTILLLFVNDGSGKKNHNITEKNNTKETFACAVNCMDGRVQDAVKNYMQENYGVDYIDVVTEPGPNKILAEKTNAVIIQNIEKRVGISVNHHGSKVVVIVGHFGCAGNPAKKEDQIEHLKRARKTIESFKLDVEIILLWVNGDWKTVEKIEPLSSKMKIFNPNL